MSFINKITYNETIIPDVPETEKIITQEVIQLNILNGCGVNGLASKAKYYLRERGFDIVEIGNSNQQYNKTTIIDRLGDRESVRRLANAIGIPDSTIVVETKTSNSLSTNPVIISSIFQAAAGHLCCYVLMLIRSTVRIMHLIRSFCSISSSIDTISRLAVMIGLGCCCHLCCISGTESPS